MEKFGKRNLKVTKEHNEDCKRLLRLLGVPVVEAPCEAEATCAELCKQGKVYAVATEDMDTLTFGSPKLAKNMMKPQGAQLPVTEISYDKALEELKLTKEQFVDMCILCGCDYTDSVRGCGPVTALKLIQEPGFYEKLTATGEKLVAGLTAAAKEAGIAFCGDSVGATPPRTDRSCRQRGRRRQ